MVQGTDRASHPGDTWRLRPLEPHAEGAGPAQQVPVSFSLVFTLWEGLRGGVSVCDWGFACKCVLLWARGAVADGCGCRPGSSSSMQNGFCCGHPVQ